MHAPCRILEGKLAALCSLLVMGVILLVIGVGGGEGVLVVGVLHVMVEVVLIFLPRDCPASVADLAEGVVEIGAAHTHPVACPLLHL